MKLISRVQTFFYRRSGGRIGARAQGLDILLLTARGRRSGARRTLPLPYFQRGEALILVASFGGNDRNPGWYHNLCAEPRVALQVRGAHFEARARIATGDERATLWASITSEQPRYLGYQAKTSREIPLIVLEGLIPRAPAVPRPSR